MRSALAYRPRGGPLDEVGAAAAAIYLLGFAAVAFIYSNPIVLAATALAVIVAGLGAGAAAALRASARWAAALAALVVLVNGLVSQRGETILVRGWELPVIGRIDVTAEALAEGGVLGLRIAVVFMAFAVYSACVDPDRVLRLVRPVARHSALTATLITRLVPLAAADYARLREAAALRGPAAAPVGRAALTRRLVAGSLDRAVDVAATLELRGYARGASGRLTPRPPLRNSRRFGIAGAVALALAIAARIAGVGDFEAYPAIAIDLDAATLALAAALPLAAVAPLAGLPSPRTPGRPSRA